VKISWKVVMDRIHYALLLSDLHPLPSLASLTRTAHFPTYGPLSTSSRVNGSAVLKLTNFRRL
jgi:hypothetical protein